MDGVEVVVEEAGEGGAKSTGAKGSVAVGEFFGSNIDLFKIRHRLPGQAVR